MANKDKINAEIGLIRLGMIKTNMAPSEARYLSRELYYAASKGMASEK